MTLQVTPRSEDVNDGPCPTTHSDQYALEEDVTEESKDSANDNKYQHNSTQESNGMQGTQGAQVDNDAAAATQSLQSAIVPPQQVQRLSAAN